MQDQPQVLSPPSPANLQPPAAYSGEQALSSAYPMSPFYPWSSQALPPSNPQYSWSSPMYYPPAAPYQAPGKDAICLQSYCTISKNTASEFLQPVTNLCWFD